MKLSKLVAVLSPSGFHGPFGLQQCFCEEDAHHVHEMLALRAFTVGQICLCNSLPDVSFITGDL